MQTRSLELNNGKFIPRIGFGTWKMTDGEAHKSVGVALTNGYRLIDTAKVYGNEGGVGAAIRESQVPREEIMLTTKLWNEDQGYDSALGAFDGSLKRLGLDYVDLYLIHWPRPERLDSWRALEEIYGSGRAKAIGVSNFTITHLEELLKVCKVTPAVNQVEFHPFLYDEQRELLEYCAEHGIVVEAYSPLAQGSRLIENEQLAAIAEKYDKSPAQVMLRWATQQGTVPLPKASSEQHIIDNLHIFDFEISPEDMRTLNGLSSGTRTAWDPNQME